MVDRKTLFQLHTLTLGDQRMVVVLGSSLRLVDFLFHNDEALEYTFNADKLHRRTLLTIRSKPEFKHALGYAHPHWREMGVDKAFCESGGVLRDLVLHDEIKNRELPPLAHPAAAALSLIVDANLCTLSEGKKFKPFAAATVRLETITAHVQQLQTRSGKTFGDRDVRDWADKGICF